MHHWSERINKVESCHGDLVMPLSRLLAWKELRTQKSFYHECSKRIKNQKVALAHSYMSHK